MRNRKTGIEIASGDVMPFSFSLAATGRVIDITPPADIINFAWFLHGRANFMLAGRAPFFASLIVGKMPRRIRFLAGARGRLSRCCRSLTGFSPRATSGPCRRLLLIFLSHAHCRRLFRPIHIARLISARRCARHGYSGSATYLN